MKTLNTEMAAEFLHISKESVERMAGEGVFPAGKVGQRWVFQKLPDLPDEVAKAKE